MLNTSFPWRDPPLKQLDKEHHYQDNSIMSQSPADSSASSFKSSADYSSALLVSIAPGQDEEFGSTLTDEATCMWHDVEHQQLVVRTHAVPPHFCPLIGTRVYSPAQTLQIENYPLWALAFFPLHPLLAMWIARNWSRSLKVEFALSQEAQRHIHSGTRLKLLGMALQLIPISLWMLTASLVILNFMDPLQFALGAVVVGAFSFLGFMLMVMGQREANLFEIEKIEGEFAWISEVHDDFLETLPEAI